MAALEDVLQKAKSLNPNFYGPSVRAAYTSLSALSSFKSKRLLGLGVFWRDCLRDTVQKPRCRTLPKRVVCVASTLSCQKSPEVVCCSLAKNFRTAESEGSKENALHKTDYEAFLRFVEAGFGEKFLEKDPTKEVAHEPLHLLDRLRHQRTTKVLSPEKEAKIEELVEKFIVDCKIKGIQVKHAFDDAAHAPKLAKIVNHVTVSQFFQGLCRLNLGIKTSDAELLAEKFGHPEHPDLVNYACFSKVANPTVPV